MWCVQNWNVQFWNVIFQSIPVDHGNMNWYLCQNSTSEYCQLNKYCKKTACVKKTSNLNYTNVCGNISFETFCSTKPSVFVRLPCVFEICAHFVSKLNHSKHTRLHFLSVQFARSRNNQFPVHIKSPVHVHHSRKFNHRHFRSRLEMSWQLSMFPATLKDIWLGRTIVFTMPNFVPSTPLDILPIPFWMQWRQIPQIYFVILCSVCFVLGCFVPVVPWPSVTNTAGTNGYCGKGCLRLKTQHEPPFESFEFGPNFGFGLAPNLNLLEHLASLIPSSDRIALTALTGFTCSDSSNSPDML